MSMARSLTSEVKDHAEIFTARSLTSKLEVKSLGDEVKSVADEVKSLTNEIKSLAMKSRLDF